MRALDSGKPRGTSGEEKERVHSGDLYSLSVAHLMPGMVSYWNVPGSGKLGDCKCPPTMIFFFLQDKKILQQMWSLAACVTVRSPYGKSQAPCAVGLVMVVGGMELAPGTCEDFRLPAVQSAIEQKPDFPFTSSALITLSQRLMCSCAIIGHKPSYSLDRT